MRLKYLYIFLSVFTVFSCKKFIYGMPIEPPTEEASEMPSSEESSPTTLSESTSQVTPEPTAGEIPSDSTVQQLDTTSISTERNGEQGNWVKKKNWLLKSYEVNNSIYSLALQIEQTKKIYKEKYDSIDAELDKFYKDLGIEHGKLQEMFDSVELYLEKKKKKDILEMTSQTEKLSASEKELRKKMEILETQITGMKDELKQLGLNMESISDVDRSLTARLQKVDEQIAFAMTSAETAKTKVESLWDIIDDKKARDIYYEVLNIENSLKSILDYLKDLLAKDFDSVIQTTKTQIASASSGIKTLESKGLIIKDRSRRVEELKVAELQKIELETELKKESVVKVVPKEEKPLGVVQKFYNFIVSTFAKGYIFITNLFSKQTGTTKQIGTEQSKKPSGQDVPSAPSTPSLPSTPSQIQEEPSFATKIPIMPIA